MDSPNYSFGLNGPSWHGIPMIGGGGLPVVPGNIYFVDYGNGSDGVSPKANGMRRPWKTIDRALDAVTTNKDDVIALIGNTAHTLDEMLTVSKSRVHFVGLDGTSRYYGQNARIDLGVTTAVTDLFTIKNIGVRNSFTNIKMRSGNTLTQSVGTLGEGGEYSVYLNCEVYNSAKLTSDTHAEMVLNGDSPQFIGCTFGSLADAVVGDKIRPAVLMTSGVVTSSQSGGPSRDVLFDGCRFWKWAGGTATVMIKIASTNDLERGMELHDCQFIASIQGSTPNVAIGAPTMTKGYIMLSGDTCGFNVTKIGTATGILSGLSAKVATATIGLQAT